MSRAPTKLDIVAITETSEREDIVFLNNVEIEGYGKYHTASKSSKGGTAIYVKNNFDTIERCDLKISNVEFETSWIEINSNNLQDDIVSGNVLLTLSEHFSQFVSVNRGKIKLKKIHLYQRDYSKFSNESFRDDVSIQNWKYTPQMLMFHLKTSIQNLKVLLLTEMLH